MTRTSLPLTPSQTPTLTPTFTPTAAASRTASAVATATPVVSTCVGDCAGTGVVNVSDLITGVDIVLGTLPESACRAFENALSVVDVAQLVKGVNNALNGCS